jgi:hypothetical protein
MKIEKFVDKTDILLYKKILNLIDKEWDNMDTDRLSELLSKLKELHEYLDRIILQKKQQSLFNENRYNDRRITKKGLRIESVSLLNIYRGILNK